MERRSDVKGVRQRVFRASNLKHALSRSAVEGLLDVDPTIRDRDFVYIRCCTPRYDNSVSRGLLGASTLDSMPSWTRWRRNSIRTNTSNPTSPLNWTSSTCGVDHGVAVIPRTNDLATTHLSSFDTMNHQDSRGRQSNVMCVTAGSVNPAAMKWLTPS